MATPRTSAAGGASRLPRPRSSTSGSSSSDRLAAVPHAAQPQLRRPPLTLPLPLPLPANDSDASENEDEHDDSPAASPGERPLMVSRRVATATFALPAHEATDAADGDVGGGHQDQDRDDDAADEPQLEAFAEPEPQLLSTSSIAALAPMPLPPQQQPSSTSAPVALAASPPPPQPIVMASSVVPPLPPPQSAAPLFSEYGVLADMPLYGIAAVDDEVYVNMSRSGQDSHPRRHRSHSHSHSHSHPHRGAYEPSTDVYVDLSRTSRSRPRRSASTERSAVPPQPPHRAADPRQQQRSAAPQQRSAVVAADSDGSSNTAAHSMSSNINRLQYTKIAQERLVILRELGSGQFGQVWVALLRPPAKSPADLQTTAAPVEPMVGVAVKMARTNRDEALRNLCNELEVQMQLSHPNIVKTLGASLDGPSPFIVTELVTGGSLLQLLKKHGANCKSRAAQPSLNLNSDVEGELTLATCVDFAIQIASGMAYLSDNGIIHRDLAARNCLLDTQLVVDGQVAVMVKICDFGQALRVRNAAVAKRTPLDAEPLPWRWLAPECLPDTNLSGEAHWSLYSDVWSFGIVLWEMISHGETPYHDLDLGGESYQDFVMRNSSHARLAQWLHQGRRLNMPSSCPPAYAAVVRSCWALVPDARPNFRELESKLKLLRQSPLALEPVGFDMDMFSERLTDRLLCSICCNVFNNPHTAPCGHTFCLYCIGRWLDSGHAICPMDRQPLKRQQLNPCLALTDVIEEMNITCSECTLKNKDSKDKVWSGTVTEWRKHMLGDHMLLL